MQNYSWINYAAELVYRTRGSHMNHLTIIFLKACAERFPAKNSIPAKLCDEMLREGKKRLEKEFQKSTLHLSSEGRVFFSNIQMWMKEVSSIPIEKSDLYYERLLALEAEGERLHKDTITALKSPGTLEPDKIHILHQEDLQLAYNRVSNAIKLEMFRIIVSGYEKSIRTIPKVKYVHENAADYFEYYAKHVFPATKMIPSERKYNCWTYQYNEQVRMGSIGKLPAFLPVDSIPKTRLLPGECKATSASATKKQWQGVGMITNITPHNVLMTQEVRIYNSVKSSQLRRYSPYDDPRKILDELYLNELYAVPPDVFFANLTLSMMSKVITNRNGSGKCIICGIGDAIPFLCLSCLGKVRQRI